MPRFFIENINEDSAIIIGDDARHIGRSLRMRCGDELILCSNAMEYTSLIEKISDSEVLCKIISSQKSLAEPNCKLTVFQAMPKSDKPELIIQKCCELGASEICFVLSSRCVSRPDDKAFRKKLERFNKVALEAAKQSGRGIIPKISGIISFNDCLKRMSDFDYKLMCYENGGENLSNVGLTKNSSIGVLIGSEGGFEQEEADSFSKCGGTLIGLGNRILRCETCPIAVTSIIMCLTGNM